MSIDLSIEERRNKRGGSREEEEERRKKRGGGREEEEGRRKEKAPTYLHRRNKNT